MDLVDKGEVELEQLTTEAVRTTTSLSGTGIKISAKVASGVSHQVVHGLRHLLDAARVHRGSQVGLREFTRILDGAREILPIQDVEVARQLSRELRRHGVTFAVERHPDGSRTFHVQGKDAQIVQHALTVASERVDERIRQQTDTEVVEAGERIIELNEQERADLLAVLRDALSEEHEMRPDPATEEQIRALADQVEREGRITLSPEVLDTLEAVPVSEAPTLADVAGDASDERAAVAVDMTNEAVVERRPDRFVKRPPDPLVVLTLDGRENETLVNALRDETTQERVTTWSQLQQADLSQAEVPGHVPDIEVSPIRSPDHPIEKPPTPKYVNEPEPQTYSEMLAEMRDGPVADGSDGARGESPQGHEEEQNTGARGESTPDLGDTRVEQIEALADEIEREGTVALTDENVRLLDRVFTDRGWDRSATPDQTPDHMGWIVDAVAQERTRIEARAVDEPVAEREPQAEAHTRPTSEQARSPEDPMGRTQGEQPVGRVEAEKAPTAKAKPDLSPRDATRARVAERIEAKVKAEKESLADRIADRLTKHDLTDGPRTPQPGRAAR